MEKLSRVEEDEQHADAACLAVFFHIDRGEGRLNVTSIATYSYNVKLHCISDLTPAI